MASYRTTRFIQISFVLLVVVLVVVAIGYVGRLLFFPTGSSTPESDNSRTSLVSTVADRAVRLTVRGPIEADEDFRTYQIQISPNNRVLTLYKGYLQQEYDNITLGNNIPAYEQFVYALDRAGMMSGSELTGDNNDTRGVCATGKLYEFDILNAGKSEKMLWTTSCSGLRGSQAASLSSLIRLFTNQIPDATSKIRKL